MVAFTDNQALFTFYIIPLELIVRRNGHNHGYISKIRPLVDQYLSGNFYVYNFPKFYIFFQIVFVDT